MVKSRRAGAASVQGSFVATSAHSAMACTERNHFMRDAGLYNKPKADQSPCTIRPWNIDDASYIIDSWANSYRRSVVTGPIEREVFNIEQRARIDRLVTRSKVFIACDAVDKRLIRGWIIFEPPRRGAPNQIPIVHYVCVQPSSQMHGIGTALVNIARQTHPQPELFMWSTHETQPMRHIRPKWNLLYNPYLLEVPERQTGELRV